MDDVVIALDASTYTGSVAVMRNGAVVAEQTAAMRGRDEERLMPAVASALANAGASPRDVRRVVCGAGPGSFTSLRIAASIAKGLATGLGVPLAAVSSLALAAVEAGPGRWLVSIDAMRGERFVAGYSWDGRALTALAEAGRAAAGDVPGLAAAMNAEVTDTPPHARAVSALLRSDAVRDVDLGAWEPSYGRLAEAQVKWEAAHGRPLQP